MSGKANIAVLVSGGGTNLQALINAQAKGNIPSCEIKLVISNTSGAFALTRAERAGIDTAVVLRRELGSAERFENRILELLDEYSIDLIVLAGFMSILSGDFTKNYPDRIINVHPSLIPSFCGDGFYGLKVHQAALDRGVKVTGATVHFVNEITDGGEIILQKAVAIRKNDTAETLQKRVMEQAEWKLLPKALAAVCRNFESEKRSNA